MAHFPPKVASAIKFQNFLLKQYTEAYCAHWDCIWANLVAVFRNTKTVISQKLTVGTTWNWHTKCPAYMYTMCQNFSSLTQAVHKLSPKVFIFDLFQDPCSISFQDHHIVLNIRLFIYDTHLKWVRSIQNFLSRPSFRSIVLVQQLNSNRTQILIISRPLILVSLQHNGSWTAHISTTQVWQEYRGPATCICRVERPNWASPRSVQHSEGHMVCYNHRLSR